MKLLKRKPQTETYIDGEKVEYYITKASPEKIYALSRKKNDGKNCGQKIVYRYNRDGTKQMVYKSIRKAADDTGVDRSAIRRCANGEYKTAGGYIWEWMSLA